MNRYLDKKYIIIAVAAVLVIAGIIYFTGGEKTKKYDIAVVTKGNVVQEVNVTGKVRPVDRVELAFENGGKVSGVYVDVGDSVFIGQTLARLDNGDTYALYLQAQANLKIEEAKLAEIKRGTRPEELAVYGAKLRNAELAVTDANKDLMDKISDAFTKSDDAVRNKSDQLFSNPAGDSPTFNYSSIGSQLKIDLEQQRAIVGKLLVDWIGKNDIVLTDNNLVIVKEFLDKVSLAVNVLSPTSSLTQATIDGYKSDVYTARSNVNTAIVNLTTSKGKLTTAESAVTLARQELILKQSGSTREQVDAGEAGVKSAEAKVSNYQAQLAKGILRSPIKGIVTKQDAKVGEIVNARANVISIISESVFEIKTNIPEADIANLSIGNTAVLTLDAYGDKEVFNAEVHSINPAETIIEGVSTYELILLFADGSGLVRSGMTANVDILTNKKDDVLFVPVRSVTFKDGKNFVRVLNENGSVEEREVETGLRGSYGDLEVISGVEEGEEVIIFEIE